MPVKVALVQCPLWAVTEPPPGLAYLAAALKDASVDVEIHDIEIEFFNEVDPVYRPLFAPDAGLQDVLGELGLDEFLEKWAKRIVAGGAGIVGLSIFFSTQEASLDLARRIKRLAPKVKIVLGGPSCDRFVHGLKLIEDPSVDAVVTGEGEQTMPELVSNLDESSGLFAKTLGALIKGAAGEVLDGDDRPVTQDLNTISFPDFTAFDLDRYARPGSLPLLTSRGCPNRCKFCSDRGFWRKYRARSAENIFTELKKQHDELGVHRFYWVDSLINGRMKELDRLLDLILENDLKLQWYGFASIRKSMTAEYLEKMARAGCVLLQYGIETGSGRVRDSMGKSSNIGLVQRVVRDTHRAGIRVQGLFIVGYPTEKTRDFLATLFFIWRNRKYIDYLVRPTCPYVCLPGSILFEERNQWGIMVDGDRYAEWTCTDPGNTYDKRKRRLALFHKFVRWIGIGPQIGLDVFSEVGTAGNGEEPDQEQLAAEDFPVIIDSMEGPARLVSGVKAKYTLRLVNKGRAVFRKLSQAGNHPVGIGYHWLDHSGQVIVFDDGARVYLNDSLDPGGEILLELEVSPPADTGDYRLRFEAVQDGVVWLKSRQAEAAEMTVVVE